MLSTQPQACPPVHYSRLSQTALASATPLPAFRRLARLPSSKTVARPWKLATCTSTATFATASTSTSARLKNGETGKEWTRNSEIKYVVQTGTFKDVAVRLRNATYRSNYSARDADEMRLLVSYSVALW